MSKKLRNGNLLLIIGLFVVLLLAGSSHAQDKPLKKIYWGVTSISASNWIPWLAKEAKIYEKNGLDVELVLLRLQARRVHGPEFHRRAGQERVYQEAL